MAVTQPLIDRRWSGVQAPKKLRAPVDPNRSPVAEHTLALIVALSVVGYPLAGVIGTLLGVQPLTASVPFRIIVDLIAVFGVYVVIARKRVAKLDGAMMALMIAYLARLIWDLQRPEFPDIGADMTFYIATGFIPTVAAGIIGGHWRDELVAKLVFYIALVAGVLVLGMEQVGFYAVADLTEATGRLTVYAVNPITFGQLGASLLLAGLVLWPRSHTRMRWIVVAGVFVGGWLMVTANSRSPFLSVAFAVAAYLVATGRWRLFAAIVALGIAVFLGGDVLDQLQGSRLVTVQDESSLTRLLVQRYALADFLEHPFLGAGYLDSVTYAYPHNILIESAMALGMGGFVLLLFIVGAAGMRSLRALKIGDVMLGMLFWQHLILSQLSGSLFGAGALFVLMMVMAVKYPAMFSPLRPSVSRLPRGPAARPAGSRPLGRPSGGIR